MTEITLVRHGQASFDSDDYDRLSPLGHQQAIWLGEYYAVRNIVFDRIIIGGQRRHRETATGILSAYRQTPEPEVHRGLNEYDFEALFASFCAQFPEQTDTGFEGRRHFYAILRRALKAWSQQQLQGPLPESWQQFSDRVQSAVDYVAQSADSDPSKRHGTPNRNDRPKVLVISSGGAISMIMKQALDLTEDHMISLNLQIINTSYCKLLKTTSRTQLLSFNNIPHLELNGREHSITYS